jgi:hypothetical protein
MKGNPDKPAPPAKVAARLRRIGLIVLLFGVCGAGAIYWHGRKPQVAADAPEGRVTADDSKQIARNAQLLYGKTAWALMGLFDDLTQPTGLAVLIVTVAAAGSFACFHLARVAEERG